jgi:GAF domain-containing protein
MARRLTKGSKAGQAKARKPGATKRGKSAKAGRRTPAVKRRKRPSASGLEARLAQRTRELDELRQQQASTLDVLKVINASAGDLGPVFDMILERAHKLCDVSIGSLQLYEGGISRAVAVRGTHKPMEMFLRKGFPVADHIKQREAAGSHWQIADAAAALARRPDQPALRAAVELGGMRTMLWVPLIRDGAVLGRIVAGRREVRPFTDTQIALLENFAAQAVIAIGNARLINETREALARQTATADVLKVIASSPSNLQPVFDAIAERSKALIGAHSTTVVRYVDGTMELASFTPVSPEADAKLQTMFPMRSPADASQTDQILRGEITQIADAESETTPAAMREMARARGWRSRLLVPLKDDTGIIGWITIARKEAGEFADKDTELLRTFADQAVIAIQNVELFEEVQKRTRDLQESLHQQTATAEVLRVIASSPTDVRPVLDAIVESACKLCDARDAYVALRDGDYLVSQTQHGLIPVAWKRRPINRQWPAGRAVVEGKSVHLRDVLAREGDEFPDGREIARHDGARTVLAVPLMREGESIGVIILRRTEVLPFTDKQIALLDTFADQAVIAIENARLFNETQEALEQQTATADILKVIASSPDDLKPVFESMLAKAMRLCEAQCGFIYQMEQGAMRAVAEIGVPPAFAEYRRHHLHTGGATTPVDEMRATKKPAHVHDARDSDAYRHGNPNAVAGVDLGGARTVLYVPMIRNDDIVGVINLYRQEVRPFTDEQLALLENFANQAVIAIENTRLLNETREALERQTATAEVLKVIASSPSDLQPVFDAIAERSKHLVGGHSTTVIRFIGDMGELAAFTPVSEEADALLRSLFPWRVGGDPQAESVLRGEIAEITDAESKSCPTTIRDLARARGFRSRLFVPLKDDNDVIGLISITRKEPGAFAERDVELLRTFADQAVIAIQNVELFQQVQQRTRELSQSLDDLRAAQDRLVQTEKLASLGQLTAGIAHEIKNPLNFVNNFSALSAELVGELDEALAPLTLDQKTKSDVGELTQMLKSNLEKIVQHGKRADSIVKNMLLHSRAGSGERRSVDVNALVEESLNLAYHGARAERPGFQVTLKHDLDPDAGTIELYPQEITRVLLNMISNGFYAVTKRAGEAGNGFEPTLQAATKGLSDRVEIRIRDNGTGIPPEVKDKMFNPFFTTKPAGEGTGLGLSMSHDIVVKQHGGTIDVETEPGHFTEFIIVLPRANGFQNKN